MHRPKAKGKCKNGFHKMISSLLANHSIRKHLAQILTDSWGFVIINGVADTGRWSLHQTGDAEFVNKLPDES